MMTINRALLWWQCRQMWPVTVVGVLVALGYVLLWPELLLWHSDYLTLLFMTLHGWWLVLSVGRPTSGRVAYLYGHGFDRDTLWKHTVLATGLSVAAVWVPIALCIWTPLRSTLQTWAFNNVEFSLMAPLEWSYPWFVLLGYAVWIPMLHYAWIREAQPFRGASSGHWLAAALVVASFTIGNTGPLRQAPPWMIQTYVVAALLLSAVLLLVGRRLHRDVEVRA